MQNDASLVNLCPNQPPTDEISTNFSAGESRCRASLIPPNVPENIPPVNAQIKYPTNSIRQRGSNVSTLDPETQFQKATIDACRSTIIQQESEIKKLREGIDIRDKTILQLQGQVGHATTALSNRNQSSVCNDHSSNCSSINQLITQLTTLVNHLSSFPMPSVNVYNRYMDATTSTKSEKSTQTLPLSSMNSSAEQLSQNSLATENNDCTEINPAHISSESEEIIHTCTECDARLDSSQALDDHLTSHHDTETNEAESNQADLSSYFTFDEKESL